MRQLSAYALWTSVALVLSSCGSKFTAKNVNRNASSFACTTPLQVTLQRTSAANPAVNEDVFFRLEATGCSGQYKLSEGDTVFTANQPFFFSRRYTTAGAVRESILVYDANYPAQATTAVEEFSVGAAASGSMSCQAVFSPANVNLNSSGKAQVSLTVSHSNVSSSIVSAVRYLSGGGMTLSSSTPVPTAAGNSHTLSLELSAAGQHFLAIDIRDSAANSTNTASCYAVANVYSGSSSVGFPDYPVFQFGSYNPAQGPINRTIFIANTSNTSVAILGASIVSPDFAIVGGSCTALPTLAPQQSCSVDVRFSPLAGPSQRSASLLIQHRPTGGGTLITSLSLQGFVLSLSAAVSLNPAGIIDFGTLAVGGEVVRPISVQNAGPSAANLGAIAISNSAFSVVGSNCPGQLPANTSCTLQVKFAPITPATYISSFVLNFLDVGGTASSTSASLIGLAEGSGATLSNGFYSSCAIRSSAIYCWGRNNYGQVGDGTYTTRTTPVPIVGLSSGVQAVASGLYHTCALQNGGVKCWGYNGYGGLGDGTTAGRTAPIAVPGLESNVTAIAAGGHSTCAIQNGALKCWGYNGYGQLGDGTTTQRSTPVEVIASGVTHISMSNEWGYAATTSCAIVNNGLKCWGYNYYGQVGDRSQTSRSAPYAVPGLETGVTQVSALMHHTCVIQNGGVKCWGYNANGQVGDASTTNRNVPTLVQGLDQGVTAIGGGAYHTCAVKAGRMLCWGYNAYGQLGDGTATQRTTPVQVAGFEYDVTEISKEDPYATCAKRQDKVYCWGYNGYGQLGDGSYTNRSAPGLVSGW